MDVRIKLRHVETCVLLIHKKLTSYIEVTMDYEKRSFGLEVGDYNVKDEKTNYRKEKSHQRNGKRLRMH